MAASSFSHEILNANPYAFLDDAPLEERRARAVELRRMLPETVLSEVGGLDPDAIDEVRRDAWPDVRDPDDLHDALLTLVAIPEADGTPWAGHFGALQAGRRAGVAARGARRYWVATERARAFSAVLPDARFVQALPDVDTGPTDRTDALTGLVRGWLAHAGPVSIAGLSERLGLPADDVTAAMLRLESEGSVLRGRFTPDAPRPGAELDASAPGPEWCDRRLLARIHRLTLGILRREIAPVSAADSMRWLLEWQHVAPGAQATGPRGTLEVLGQLQGFEAPANAWETQLLARRIARYDPGDLDQLCLTGAAGWGRLSPHPSTVQPAEGRPARRVIPTSVAPITFFIRDDADWMAPPRAHQTDAESTGLARAARDVLRFLQTAGASFFADIVRGTRLLKAEVEGGLWELVAAGLVTADGFDNLRALIDPRRRAGHGTGRHARPRHSAGRWALLHTTVPGDRTAMLEATCWMLLRRYGIVFREILARESVLPAWRELLIVFRRLEDRGEVRGGRFVTGLIGEQFALPVAVESLRAMRHRRPTGQVVTVAAADPLNLVGILVPGERVPAVSGRFAAFRDGVAVPPDISAARVLARIEPADRAAG